MKTARIIASIVAASVAIGITGGPPDDTTSDEPVLLALGFSNAHVEFRGYQQRVGTRINASVYRHGRVLLVNGAFGGMSTDRWTVPDAFDKARQRLPGGDESSVRFVWFKILARGDRTYRPDTTAFVEALAEDCGRAIRIMRGRYPNLQAVFVSGRTYAGWAVDYSTEPYARLTWKAAEVCIADNPVADRGPRLWDPAWPRSYFHPDDGRHLSAAGRQAAAVILDDFFAGVL